MIKALKILLIVGALIAVFHPASAFAADRYWVGGTGNWDASATTHWSATSGGSSGASVPTSADTVTFDSLSNATAYTVTVTATASTSDITFGNPLSGALTFAGSAALNVYGNFTVVDTITRTYTGTITFRSTTTGRALTTNGVVFGSQMTFNGSGGGWILQDDLDDGTSTWTITNGTVNTNDQTLSIGVLNGNGGNITLGSSLVNLTGTGTIFNPFGSMTVTADTSTIKIVNTSNSNVAFITNIKIFYNVWFSRGASTGTITIGPSNTFNDLKDTGTAAHTLAFSAGTTQTMNTFSVSGSSGNLITITSNGTTATHTLVKSGGGTISSDYLDIQHSVATPASTWYAGTHSTNHQATATAGSGWIFTAPPVVGTGPAHIGLWRGMLKANIRSFGSVLIANISKWTGVN